ncbi:dUTPase [Orgyia leucostigma nucleopolyhedrovirus]|uniref:dUTP diphosphatase n=1 Tax=Orgyia leucostigma nucleopolyhedrovirus TaxID=490711 RepID=B0FDW3_9ABAC|nr:dUTPase [Orgyia leucostigma nucleopolyhedrovirus]ABY65821.1 dUTPase [Orgyia leucostigma nucleopolyhedrovirus]
MNACKLLIAPRAFAPQLATDGSAGYDLRAPEDFVIKARDSCTVDTGLAIELPRGLYAKIESKSGLAFKHQIVVAAGVVDNDYRGKICVILMNHGKRSRQFKRGDKIAQMVLHKYYTVPMVEADVLSSTERACNGFGSTGR